jgi:hypothetical protein
MPVTFPLEFNTDAVTWKMTFSAFFDESGKFKDQPVISFSGIAATSDSAKPFMDEWKAQLFRSGLKVLTMKDALHYDHKLSKKKPAMGIKNRVEALRPFILCIRKHLSLAVCMAVNVDGFKNLSSQDQTLLGTDPHYLAFTRALIDLLEPLQKTDLLSVICDDEEKTAWPMYTLYRKVKLAWPDARKRLVSLSFADDEVFPPLQAADMIAGLTRLYAKKEFFGEENPYQDLFDALGSPDRFDRLWGFKAGLFDVHSLTKMVNSFRALQQKHGRDVNLFDFSV